MEYALGVDLGTTYTAAAVNVDGSIETVRLGGRGPEIPSLVFLREDGEVLVGEAAQRRGESEPTRLAREFKRRLGDPVPVRLGDTPMTAEELTARLLGFVVATVTDGQGGPPRRIVITHPANWGPYKRDLLAQAARSAGVPQATLRTEPEAAVIRYAATERVAVGETIAVYDLGGGTFDAAVLRKTADGFDVLGEPQGVEQLGGTDFDEAVLEYVRASLGDRLAGLDLDDPGVTEALARLRRECVEAKENLSFDTEAEISVALPRLHTRVRLRRSDFEALIAPALEDTVAALRRALRSASVEAEDLRCVVLAGGSSRIPLVGLMVSRELGRPVVLDEQPELGIALGAARLAGPAAPAGAPREPTPFVLVPPPRVAAPSTPAAARTTPAAATEGQPVPAAAASTAAASPTAASTAAASTVAASAAAAPDAASPGARGPLPPAMVASMPVSVPGSSSPFGRPPANAEPLPRFAASAHAVPPPDGPVAAGGGAWSRLRAYRWPVIGGFAAVLLTVTVVTAAAAWPRDQDGQTPAGNAGPAGSAPAAPAAQAELVWKVDSGAAPAEPPAVSAEHVVVSGQDGTLRSFRRADGGPEWNAAVGDGARASTRIVGGGAYAITGDGGVVGVDAASGAERWRRSTGKPIKARPVAEGDQVFVAGGDGVLSSYEIGKGGRRWRVWTEGEIGTPPAVAGQTVVVASGDGLLYGVSDAGALLWKVRVGRVTGGPVVARGAVCVPVDDGTAHCVRIPGGDELPVIKDEVAIERIYGGEGVLVAAGEDGSVTAWDPATAAMTWRYRSPAGATGAGFPVVRTGLGEVDVAFPDGRLIGLDAANGTVRWRNATGDRFSTAPRGDNAGLFAVGDGGTVYALRPPGSGTLPPVSSAPPTTPPPATEPEREPTTEPTRRRTTNPTRTRTSTSTKPSPSDSATTTTTPTTTTTTDPTATTVATAAEPKPLESAGP